MYQLFNLGLLIGTRVSFVLWCLLFIAVGLIVAVKRLRTGLGQLLRHLLVLAKFSAPKRLFFIVRIAQRDQRLPVQLEIFEQNLTTRVRSFLSQFRYLAKILR